MLYPIFLFRTWKNTTYSEYCCVQFANQSNKWVPLSFICLLLKVRQNPTFNPNRILNQEVHKALNTDKQFESC